MDASHTVAVTAAIPTASPPGQATESVPRPAPDLRRGGGHGGRGSRWWGGVPWSRSSHRSRVRRDEVDRKNRRLEIRTIWRQVAQDTGLATFMFSPSGWMWAAPDLRSIDTGVDEAFTVHLRTGQTWDQLRAAGRHIATAFGVRAVRLVELAPDWVRIELLPDYERPAPLEPPQAVVPGPAIVEPVEPVVPPVPGWAVAVRAMVDVRIMPEATSPTSSRTVGASPDLPGDGDAGRVDVDGIPPGEPVQDAPARAARRADGQSR